MSVSRLFLALPHIVLLTSTTPVPFTPENELASIYNEPSASISNLNPAASPLGDAINISCHTLGTSPKVADVQQLSLKLQHRGTELCYDPAADGLCVFLDSHGGALATYCVPTTPRLRSRSEDTENAGEGERDSPSLAPVENGENGSGSWIGKGDDDDDKAGNVPAVPRPQPVQCGWFGKAVAKVVASCRSLDAKVAGDALRRIDGGVVTVEGFTWMP